MAATEDRNYVWDSINGRNRLAQDLDCREECEEASKTSQSKVFSKPQVWVAVWDLASSCSNKVISISMPSFLFWITVLGKSTADRTSHGAGDTTILNILQTQNTPYKLLANLQFSTVVPKECWDMLQALVAVYAPSISEYN